MIFKTVLGYITDSNDIECHSIFTHKRFKRNDTIKLQNRYYRVLQSELYSWFINPSYEFVEYEHITRNGGQL